MTNVLLAVAATVLLAADDPKAEAKKELAKLEGTWKTEQVKYNGEDVSDQVKLTLVLKGDQVTLEGNDEVKKDYAKVSVKVDPTTSPRCLDIKVLGGQQKDATMEGIYEVKGDRLRLCVKVLGKDRPGKFESPEGSSIALLVLKRDKP